MVLNWAALGGAERRALALARWLKEEEEANVEVLALTESEGRAVEAARALGLSWRTSVVHWNGGKAAKARDFARFVRALRQGRPELVMPYCALPNVLSGLSWRMAGASTCVWYQADVSPFSRARESTRRRAVRSTPVLVANADHVAEHLVSEWGAQRERIRVIRVGVEVPRPEADRVEWRSRLGIGTGDFVANMAAHFRRSKDHATLLRAWRLVVDELARSDRRAVLLLAGDPYPMGDAAKALAFDLGLERAVQFVGEVHDIAGLAGAIDIGILSSHREGFSTSLIECMAAGISVAGTDIPGIREVVGAEGHAFLAPPGDADALAQVVLRLARDDALRATLGASCRERVRREFTTERMVASYSNVLAEALARRCSPRARLRARR